MFAVNTDGHGYSVVINGLHHARPPKACGDRRCAWVSISCAAVFKKGKIRFVLEI